MSVANNRHIAASSRIGCDRFSIRPIRLLKNAFVGQGAFSAFTRRTAPCRARFGCSSTFATKVRSSAVLGVRARLILLLTRPRPKGRTSGPIPTSHDQEQEGCDPAGKVGAWQRPLAFRSMRVSDRDDVAPASSCQSPRDLTRARFTMRQSSSYDGLHTRRCADRLFRSGRHAFEHASLRMAVDVLEVLVRGVED